MAAVNLFVLEGRVAIQQDKVQLRESYPGDANASCSFRFAVDRYKQSNGLRSANFFTCVAFGCVAEYICNYCSRGTPLIITGRIGNNKNGDVEFLLDTAKIINGSGGAANVK